jgi:hypothetical protein
VEETPETTTSVTLQVAASLYCQQRSRPQALKTQEVFVVRLLVLVVLVATLVAVGVSVFAADIVTVPTANQLKKGQVDVAYYWIGLDKPAGQPQHVQAQTVYLGLTDEIEIDLHRYEVDNDRDSTVVNASFSLMRETTALPDVVVGGRNIFQAKTTNNPAWDSNDRSYFLCLAKTLNLPKQGPPAFPIIRLHLSYGTHDPSLLGEDRHNGFFGGIQAKLTKQIGAIALHDGEDVITGLTYSPSQLPNLTIKGGGFGEHWWAGISYAKTM